jgi:predicted Fe-Mo cluster-binding NifX family protein
LRIGMPIVKDQGLDSEIEGHFGRAAYFMVVDLKNGKPEKRVIRDEDIKQMDIELTVVRNLAEHACSTIVDLLMSNNIDVLLVEGIGGRPFELFKQNGVGIYAGAFGTVKEIIRDYLNGMLQELQAGSCGSHNHTHTH